GPALGLPVCAGRETAEWAWDRPDVRGRVRHARPQVLATFTTGLGVTGNQYLAVLPLGARYAVRSLRFRALPGAPPLRLVKAGLFDGDGSRAAGASTGPGYGSGGGGRAGAAG